jgi:hypothetical protein
VSERTVRKWVARYQGEADAGLRDRSCRPHRSPTATPPLLVHSILRLRRQRWTGGRDRGDAAAQSQHGRPPVAPARLDAPAAAQAGGAGPALPVGAAGRPGIWTSRSWAESGAWDIASPATGARACAASDGSSCTWPSMTPRVWRTSRSSATKAG